MKLRVNISLTQEDHDRLKSLAEKKECSVSHMVSELARMACPGPGTERLWLLRIDDNTLERIEQYSFEHHIIPEQAVIRWIWAQKVSSSVIRGQMSFFDQA